MDIARLVFVKRVVLYSPFGCERITFLFCSIMYCIGSGLIGCDPRDDHSSSIIVTLSDMHLKITCFEANQNIAKQFIIFIYDDEKDMVTEEEIWCRTWGFFFFFFLAQKNISSNWLSTQIVFPFEFWTIIPRQAFFCFLNFISLDIIDLKREIMWPFYLPISKTLIGFFIMASKSTETELSYPSRCLSMAPNIRCREKRPYLLWCIMTIGNGKYFVVKRNISSRPLRPDKWARHPRIAIVQKNQDD